MQSVNTINEYEIFLEQAGSQPVVSVGDKSNPEEILVTEAGCPEANGLYKIT
jgi:hypothetical protein